MLHPCPLVPAWVAHLQRIGIDSQGWVLSLELVTGCGGLPADFSLKVKGDTLQQWCAVVLPYSERSVREISPGALL